MKLGNYVVKCLEDLNIKYSAGIPGSHILAIYDGLIESHIKHVTTRYEGNAAVIADSYGRLTGKPMAVIVTAGPGATNTVTGVAQAYGAASPLILISGSVNLGSGPSTFHGVDDPLFLMKMFQPITKFSRIIKSQSELPQVLGKGYSISMDGRRGPVYIGIPMDICNLDVKNMDSCRIKLYKHPFSKIKLRRLIRILSGKRILLVLGAEVFTSIDKELIIDISRSLNSPIITQIEGLGYIPQENELFAGYIEKSWNIHPIAKYLLNAADYILFIGLRPGEQEYSKISDGSRALYVGYTHGTNEKSIGMYIVGDLVKYLINLRNVVGKSGKWYEDAINKGEKVLKRISNVDKFGPGRKLNPGYVSKIISEYIPRNSLLTVDVGTHETWARIFIGSTRKVRYLYPGNYGSMGFSIPAAIGGWLAGYKHISSIIGDGGLLMCMEELATIAENNIDVKIFVYNDSSYGMIYHLQQERFGRSVYAHLTNVDFSRVAEAMGVEGIKVDNNVEDAIKDAYKHNGPILVDIPVDYKIRYFAFK